MFHKKKLRLIKIPFIIHHFNTNLIIHFFLDWPVSLLGGIAVTFLYCRLFLFIAKTFEECFTLGEAGVASQVVILIVYSLLVNILNFIKNDKLFRSNMQISTIIIQVSCSIKKVLCIYYQKCFPGWPCGNWNSCLNYIYVKYTKN